MRSSKSSVRFVLCVLPAAGMAALAFAHSAAAKPDAGQSWKVARPLLVCGDDAAGGVSACRVDTEVTRQPDAADHGVVTVLGLDPAGRELGCWNGERLVESSARASVHLLAPTAELGQVRSFQIFVSAWGCWGTPEALGARVQVPRASARRDAKVVDEVRQVLRHRREAGEGAQDPDPQRGWELGPVLSGPRPGEGC